MRRSETCRAIAVLSVVALVTLTGCDRQGLNRQPPPPAGASVHQSPTNAAPPASQGPMTIPPRIPDVPIIPATP